MKPSLLRNTLWTLFPFVLIGGTAIAIMYYSLLEDLPRLCGLTGFFFALSIPLWLKWFEYRHTKFWEEYWKA